MQDIKPVKNELYGVWVYNHGEMQWTINNTKGVNIGGSFIDIHKSGHRYLKVRVLNIDDTYEINSVTEHNLDLTDSKGVNFVFEKMSNPAVNY